MLPAEPKIFHGRDTELNQVLDILNQPLSRVAILGAGDIGKTSLAKMVLHHPITIGKYQNNRLFVSCDSVGTSVDLASLIATHLGLQVSSGGNAIKRVVQHLTSGPPCLVVLDNIETAWEPPESRADIEEFLSLLTDVQHLALMITMRGAERPAKVQWTRPFLRPLQPLAQEAARQIFLDITDDIHDHRDVDKLLLLTDNLPLAIDLIARLVDDEGCTRVLFRWEKEKIRLLSEGHNKTKTTSLEVSIMLSLHSPRVLSLSGTKALLSLLSVLPDGITDTELLQSAPDIPDILAAKTALLRTSLAYISLNHGAQLKVLAPIREYVKSIYPPAPCVVLSVRQHFHGLLKLYQKYRGFLSNAQLLDRIVANLGNLQSLLILALETSDSHSEEVLECALLFARVCHFSGRGRNIVWEYISSALSTIPNARLHVRFLADTLKLWRECPIVDPAGLFATAEDLFQQFDDNDTKR
ncbi:P-loop containing nucleoside triphosphate hydrolase protein [Mycena galopus ATCC 62051]|nr:P-loop containing nucleoside triphosphate hydrolase protein [Mycena galopus ATCC 62051]